MTTGPLTLPQAKTLDFDALWWSLPSETQAHIGALALRYEAYFTLREDGGFHTTDCERDIAEGLADKALDELRPTIWQALPDLMPTVYDEPYPLWQMLESGEPPATVDVRGLGVRPLVKDGWQWFVPDGSTLVLLGGAVDLDSHIKGAPHRWQFWTAVDIEAERLRRHPEITTPRLIQQEHQHDRAA